MEALKGLESKSKLIKGIFPQDYKSAEIKNEINKINEYIKKANRKNMIYYSSQETFDFNAFKIW